MPALLTERYNVSNDEAFRARVEIALVGTAIAIQAEDPATGDHYDRSDLALKVLRNPQGWSVVFAKGVASHTNVGLGGNDDPTTDSEGGDSALQFVINSIWNAYANQPEESQPEPEPEPEP